MTMMQMLMRGCDAAAAAVAVFVVVVTVVVVVARDLKESSSVKIWRLAAVNLSLIFPSRTLSH